VRPDANSEIKCLSMSMTVVSRRTKECGYEANSKMAAPRRRSSGTAFHTKNKKQSGVVATLKPERFGAIQSWPQSREPVLSTS
jgi:hypothetical protein